MKPIPAVFTVLIVITSFSLAGAAPLPSHLDTHHAALQALQAGNTLEAIDLFSQAIAASPKDYRYYNDRGVAYRKSGDLKMALADYNKALELQPNYTNALNNRGLVHMQQGDYDKALKDFTEALKHGGLEGTILTNLGRVHALQGDHAGAMREFEKALSHSPIDNRAFLFIAESHEKMGQQDKAFKMYQLALGLIKDPSTAEYIKGRMAALGKTEAVAQPRPKPSPTAVTPPAEKVLPPNNAPSRDAAPKQRQTRQILPARPVQQPSVSAPKRETPPPRESGVKTVQDLDILCRKRALNKFSPAAVEIYKQGMEFLDKSDHAKALVRFEDTRQLEKRKKNPHGVAWNNLEVGRVYVKMGQYHKATAALQEALKAFEQLKATDEIVLAKLELALNQKASGQKDKAEAYYQKAIQRATASGHTAVATAIGDMAAGKAPASEQQAKVEQAPSQAAPPPSQTPAPPTGAPQPSTETRPVLAQASPPPSTGSRNHEQTQAAPIRLELDGLTKVGRGPLEWGQTGKTKRPVRPLPHALPAGSVVHSQPKPPQARPQTEERISSAPKVSPSPKTPPLQSAPGVTSPAAARHPVAQQPVKHGAVAARPAAPDLPQTTTPPPVKDRRSAARKRADERQIRQDLAQLSKLRQTEHEDRMIPILERLAEKYIKSGDYEKALHCLLASAGYREKLLVTKGTDRVLGQRGLLRQKLGRPVEALEDYTHASVLSDSGHGSSRRELDDRAQKLASEMGLDAPAALRAFKSLWQARESGDAQAETQALLLLGRLYDKARRPAQALEYYERSSASMLADKARIYEALGWKDQAQQSYNQALDAFKKLDYSRYLRMMRKTEPSEAISRR